MFAIEISPFAVFAASSSNPYFSKSNSTDLITFVIRNNKANDC